MRQIVFFTSPTTSPTLTGMPTFGQQLRAVRRRLGVSQKELALRLGHTGGNSTVSGWERLSTPPAPESVRRIARALDVSPADLLLNVPTKYDDDQDALTVAARYRGLSEQQRALVRDLIDQLMATAEYEKSG